MPEEARAFIAKMRSDAASREKVAAIAELDERLAFINGEGFSRTVDEIERAQSESSEAELQAVTGGGCGPFKLCSRDDESLCQAVGWVVALRRRRIRRWRPEAPRGPAGASGGAARPRGRVRRRRTATRRPRVRG